MLMAQNVVLLRSRKVSQAIVFPTNRWDRKFAVFLDTKLMLIVTDNISFYILNVFQKTAQRTTDSSVIAKK